MSRRIDSISLLCLLVCSFLFGCKNDRKNSAIPVPEELPMTSIELDGLSGFVNPGPNWKIVSNVFAGYEKEGFSTAPGEGVLVNQFDPSIEKPHLFTAFEHGDIELEVDFLMPKGSNSGIYFQGRYEVQLLDSWRVKNPTFADCGGIYQRWDETKPEGRQGSEGTEPRVNACKAPGLWQHIKVFFRAPRFDANGKKTANAKFENIYLNGYLIHENVEVTGPTRAAFFKDENETGPVVIQGHHGPVAIRNLRYKAYTNDSIKLSDLRYDLYESDSYSYPDFSNLKLLRSDAAVDINVPEAAGKSEFYALEYNANMTVPVSGEYLFTAFMDEGGEIFVDDKILIRTGNLPGQKNSRGLIHLAEGTHALKIRYFQATWYANITLFYEGPGISKKPLGMPPVIRDAEVRPQPMIVEATQKPELVRSFLQYRDTVKTHAISVGDPKNVHYTFDLNHAALIKAWKGLFADAYGMWHERGESQLLQLGNFAIEPEDGLPVAFLENEDDRWPYNNSAYRFSKYTIDENGYPVFHYKYDNLLFEDRIVPSADSLGLVRSITVSGKTDKKTWYRIAAGDPVIQLGDGSYNIGGDFYLKIENAKGAKVRSGKELVAPLLENNQRTTIQYSIIW